MTNDEAIRILMTMKGEMILAFDHDRKVALDKAIETMQNSPTQMSGTSDTISRRQAVDAICKEWCCHGHDACEYKTMMENGFDPCDGCSDVDAIMELPSAQPERKTGKWIEVNDAYNRVRGRCSICGWESHMYEDDVVGMDYCPNCGARLEAE